MRSMTVESVARWLSDNRLPMTSVELFHEWRAVHRETCGPLLDAIAHLTAVGAECVVERAVVDMLVAYGEMKGGTVAVRRVVKRAIARMESSDSTALGREDRRHDDHRGTHRSTAATIAVSSSSDGSDNGESGPVVVAADDKGRGEERRTAARDAGRESLLSALQARLQQTEVKLARTILTLSERLPHLVSIVDPMRKDVLVPIICLTATLGGSKMVRTNARVQLLTLYNRPNGEHRAVIAKAWANTLQDAPPSVLEDDIISELYILTNAKSTERRILAVDCVACLAPLLEKQHHDLRWTICQGVLKPLSDDDARTVRCHVVKCIEKLWPELPDDFVAGEGDKQTAEESLLCYVELIVQLILHDSSGKVRHCALQSLRDCLGHSTRMPHRVVLRRIIPLFFSFLERESIVITTSGNFASQMEGSSFASVIVPKKDDAVESAVSRNIMTLSNLIEYALRSTRESALGGGGVDSFAFDAYIRVVLPSAYSLVLGNQEKDAFDASVCAVGAALASIVSAFDMGQWQRVRQSLESFATKGTVLRCGDVSAPCRRQMCFFFAFLACVVGGANFPANSPARDTSTVHSAIAKDAAALLGETLASDVENKKKEAEEKRRERLNTGAEEHQLKKDKEMTTRSDASAVFNACTTSLIWFATCVEDPLGRAAAVSSVLWSLAESPSAEHQMLAIALLRRVDRLVRDDRVRELHMWPPLLALMNNTTHEVREAAVKAALSIVTYVSTPSVQEKIMKLALAIVEAEGCPSRLSVGLLRHWSTHMREMPAEPREMFLYPQLLTMIEQLCAVLRRMGNQAVSAKAAEGVGCQSHAATDRMAEDALEAVLAVLAAIPHCAVVTPPLVQKYMIPGIRLLASVPSLPLSSRSQLMSIEKEYGELLGSSKGVRGTFGLFERIRGELKKQL